MSQFALSVDVDADGVGESVLIRPEDEVLRGIKAPMILFEAGDPSFDPATKTGHDLIQGEREFYTGTGMSVIANRAWMNNKPVIQCAGTSHDRRFVNVGLPASFFCCVVMSFSAATRAALNSSDISRYAWSLYDSIGNAFGAQVTAFSTAGQAIKGWSLTPRTGISGNGLLVRHADYPEILPAPETAFCWGWDYSDPETSSHFYWKTGVTAIAGKADHAAGPPGGNMRLWPGSVFAGPSFGWDGDIAEMLWADNTNPETALTPVERAALMARAVTKYNIP